MYIQNFFEIISNNIKCFPKYYGNRFNNNQRRKTNDLYTDYKYSVQIALYQTACDTIVQTFKLKGFDP